VVCVCVLCGGGAAGKNLWDLQAVIVKSNDDVRQEVFIMQLISFYEVRACCVALPYTFPPSPVRCLECDVARGVSRCWSPWLMASMRGRGWCVLRQQETFKQAGIPLWLRPYKIMSTGNSTGLISVRSFKSRHASVHDPPANPST
jgi:hypothetical protein